MKTLKLVGVTLEELETALEFSGLYINGDTIRAIPSFIKQQGTTLEMWEKIGEHQEREREANEKLAKIEAALRGG